MFNTYLSFQIHCILAVKFKEALIQKKWEDQLHQFLHKAIRANYHQLIAASNVPDHLHMIISVRATESVDDLIEKIKTETEEWIRMKKFVDVPFSWQDGYAAFSCSQESITGLIKYLHRQEDYHKRITFLDEYRQYLNEYGIEFEEADLFTEPESYYTYAEQ